MTQNSPSIDPAQIALDLAIRSTPKGEGISRALLEADYTEDVEQVNGFGVYSTGREAVFAAAQQAAGADKTVGLDTKVVSASLLAPNVILAHLLSSADIPQGPLAGKRQFRFTLVILNRDGAWQVRSTSTTLVQRLPT